jgi:hypothetical protein
LMSMEDLSGAIKGTLDDISTRSVPATFAAVVDQPAKNALHVGFYPC